MKSVDDHLSEILDMVRPLAPIELDIREALGAVLAEDVASAVELPPFDNSAMDGYAVRAADVAAPPVELPVVGDIAAGDHMSQAIPAGTCVRIMTGAPIPAGADAVVPVEWTDGGTARVTISRSPESGNAIRRSGEDVRAGDVVLRAGARIGAPRLGMLAATGRRTIRVRPRPRVVVMSTGAELVEPGVRPARGQIWDSNSYTLSAAATEAGAVSFRHGAVGDDPAELLEALETQLLRADVIVTSGGVSMGAYEPVKDALSGTIKFDQVAMQPGKPQGFGIFQDVPFFALPGNPVSCFVSFVLFVRPALSRLQGLPASSLATVPAVTTAPLRSPLGKRSYLRGQLTGDTVAPVRAQGSHQLAALAAANALVVVPEDVTSLESGSDVEVIPL